MEFDPEIVKAGAPLLGTALGGLIGVVGGWLVSRSTQAGARAIARDNARREDLRDLLGPLRMRVSERTQQLENARDAAFFMLSADEPDDDELIALATAALAAIKVNSDAETGAWSAAGHAHIVALYQQWSRLDRRCYWNMREIERGQTDSTSDGPEQKAMWAAYAAAAVALTSAINDLLHGPAQPARASVLRLPWKR